jgi:hypothetical protein
MAKSAKTENAAYTSDLRVRLTKRQHALLKSYMAGKGIDSQSELIRQAILDFIGRDANDSTLQLQASRRLEKEVRELRDMVDVLFRFVCYANVNMLGYHPEIPEEMAASAFDDAKRRHDTFFRSFQKTLEADPSFFERLLHNYYSKA